MRRTTPQASISGLIIDDIERFEINETFAVVPMKFKKELGVPEEKST